VDKVQKTKEKIEQPLKSDNFLKPNGKINISLVAKSMNMNRKTIAKYINN